MSEVIDQNDPEYWRQYAHRLTTEGKTFTDEARFVAFQWQRTLANQPPLLDYTPPSVAKPERQQQREARKVKASSPPRPSLIEPFSLTVSGRVPARHLWMDEEFEDGLCDYFHSIGRAHANYD